MNADTLIKENEIFVISNNQDTTLRTENGVKVFLRANCFGGIKDSLRIKIWEYNELSSMILEGLSTTSSEGKILETSGMVKIEVSKRSDNKIRDLKNNKCWIYFPNKKKNHSIFYGNKKNENIYWEEGDNIVFIDEKTLNDKNFNKSEYFKNLRSTPRLPLNQMGWVNADKFIPSTDKGGRKLIVNDTSGENRNVSMLLLLKNYNSIIPPSIKENNKRIFKSIPKGEKCKVFCLSQGNKKNYLRILSVQSNQKSISFSKMRQLERDELKSKIKNVVGERL